jgi:3-deoxy-D-manno-octulosonic-acid transferase
MYFFYSLITLLSTPFVLLYFALRGLRDRSYLGRWRERFGLIAAPGQAGGLLIHAASVGEFNAASPLIRALLDTYPDLPLSVTTQTPTGSERVKRELGDSVFHCYIPIDLPGAVARFLNRLQPQLIIVMETEIWPNLYRCSARKNIPLIMVNARLSARSFYRFQYVSGLIRKTLQTVTWVGAQSKHDAERLIQCGTRTSNTEISGNLKFELTVPDKLDQKSAALRSRWNALRPVLVAGSTHEADENVVIPAFVAMLETLPDALLILVPRHPERFARTAQLAIGAGLRTELRSQGESCSEQAQCFVIDSIGELITYYACADVVFVGGSMGEQGGHNALEPAALGKPVLLGPNMDNARQVASQLLQCKAALCVNDKQEFRQKAEKILTDKTMQARMGLAGKTLLEKNRGALDLSLEAIKKLL